ncbi:hypothetical protein PR048_026691 [Dryococelus australis]|uniref:Transposase n=1 Tax=Dryococelus australis TaxID=614101 RepID=A0ABQ9GM33_9NEOP|nr:hypothetical protein PR048_026691 [Dryococelus australis]
MKHHPELSVRFAANIKRTRAAINEQILRDYVRNLGEVVKDIPSENIWNFDESNLTDDPGRKTVIVKCGIKYPEKICSQKSVSIMIAGSAAGDIPPPYVVYRSSHL